ASPRCAVNAKGPEGLSPGLPIFARQPKRGRRCRRSNGLAAELFHRERHAGGQRRDRLLGQLERRVGQLAGIGHRLLYRGAGIRRLQVDRLLDGLDRAQGLEGRHAFFEAGLRRRCDLLAEVLHAGRQDLPRLDERLQVALVERHELFRRLHHLRHALSCLLLSLLRCVADSDRGLPEGGPRRLATAFDNGCDLLGRFISDLSRSLLCCVADRDRSLPEGGPRRLATPFDNGCDLLGRFISDLSRSLLCCVADRDRSLPEGGGRRLATPFDNGCDLLGRFISDLSRSLLRCVADRDRGLLEGGPRRLATPFDNGRDLLGRLLAGLHGLLSRVRGLRFPAHGTPCLSSMHAWLSIDYGDAAPHKTDVPASVVASVVACKCGAQNLVPPLMFVTARTSGAGQGCSTLADGLN